MQTPAERWELLQRGGCSGLPGCRGRLAVAWARLPWRRAAAGPLGGLSVVAESRGERLLLGACLPFSQPSAGARAAALQGAWAVAETRAGGSLRLVGLGSR